MCVCARICGCVNVSVCCDLCTGLLCVGLLYLVFCVSVCYVVVCFVVHICSSIVRFVLVFFLSLMVMLLFSIGTFSNGADDHPEIITSC